MKIFALMDSFRKMSSKTKVGFLIFFANSLGDWYLPQLKSTGYRRNRLGERVHKVQIWTHCP